MAHDSTIMESPESVEVATITFYPGWQPDAPTDGNLDQLRGNLALQSFEAAQTHGYGVTVVDGGSSDAFKETASEFGAKLVPQAEASMSGARRQALRSIVVRRDVEVICLTEPEKVSLVEDFIPALARPILEGEAEIVVPQRTEESFATYPPFQAAWEQKSNRAYHGLKQRMDRDDHPPGYRAPEEPVLDMFMGPRIIMNKPGVIEPFLRVYNFRPNPNLALHRHVNTEGWTNTLFFPLMVGVHYVDFDVKYRRQGGVDVEDRFSVAQDTRTLGIPVDYQHPPEQTQSEIGNQAFDAKRVMQSRGILTAVKYYVQEGRRIAPDHLLRLRADLSTLGTIDLLTGQPVDPSGL